MQVGQTALFEACYVGHLEGVQMLWGKGADVDHQDAHGWTALMIGA